MKYVLLSVMALALFACSKDSDLDRTIFQPDPAYPELPRYSEWGYNTFGALYDRQAFVSNNNDIPARVLRDSVMTIVFTGHRGNAYYYGPPSLSLTFRFKGYNPKTFEDLIGLDQTTIDLTSADSQVELNEGAPVIVKVLGGTFHVKRAQRLLVDEKVEEVILSGEFEFHGMVDNVPLTLSNGRFDIGVTERNFFGN